MYIKHKLSDFVYDFVQAKICTCTKIYYSVIQLCTADIGHRTNTNHEDGPNFAQKDFIRAKIDQNIVSLKCTFHNPKIMHTHRAYWTICIFLFEIRKIVSLLLQNINHTKYILNFHTFLVCINVHKTLPVWRGLSACGQTLDTLCRMLQLPPAIKNKMKLLRQRYPLFGK